jgi:membrane protein DedA with SNARE-associated domain
MSFDFISLEAIQNLAHTYGYWFIFFGIMLENAGIPLPGETITLVGGFLSGSGELNYAFVLACTTFGAIIGDSCGYWLGKWGGIKGLEKIGKLLRLSHENIALVRDKFVGNADRAVFFGRFITLLRIFAGPMAGLSGMPYGRFMFFNAVGAIAWSLTMTGLAYFAGNFISLDRLVGYMTQFGLLLFVAVAIWLAVPPLLRLLKKWRVNPTKSIEVIPPKSISEGQDS